MSGSFTDTTLSVASSTCTAGVCSFSYSCSYNGDCSGNLCVSDVCTTCTTDAECETGTFADDASDADYDTAKCSSGVCKFSDDSSDDGLSGGAIAGIIIGSIVFVILVVAGIWFLTKSGESDTAKSVAYETLDAENHNTSD